jgi:hypothetical protein
LNSGSRAYAVKEPAAVFSICDIFVSLIFLFRNNLNKTRIRPYFVGKVIAFTKFYDDFGLNKPAATFLVPIAVLFTIQSI